MLGPVEEPGKSEREKALLGNWARGDRASGEALLELLLPGIYGLCMRILKNPSDAEEAAQETFARLCSEVRDAEEVRHVRKWAVTVAMNLCFDKRRGRSKETLVDPATESPVAEETLDSGDLELLRERLEELPERYQLVLHYGFVMDLN